MEESLKLQARHYERTLQIYWLGKWRSVRYYQGKANVPSKKIVDEMLVTFRLNSGVKTQPITLSWEV